jgi:outer membrane beta-barrel protein
MMSAREERSFRERKGLFAMKRFILALAFAVVAIGGTTACPTPVQAQEILLEGPLAGAPAVRKVTQYRKMRFSVGPQIAYTFLAPYMHVMLVGGRAEFNITDWLGVGLVGYYAFNFSNNLTDYISTSHNAAGGETIPTDSNWPSYTGAANFEDQVALMKGMYLAQVNFIPFRGKMSMFNKVFVAIDGAIFLGGGVVQFEEREACDGSQNEDGSFNDGCGDYDQFKESRPPDTDLIAPTRVTQFGGAFTWGVGVMAYVNDWFALNLEFRMTPFKWNAGGTDEAGQSASMFEYSEYPVGSDNPGDAYWRTASKGSGDYPDGKIGDEDRTWNLNMNIALGFIFYFPLKPRIED